MKKWVNDCINILFPAECHICGNVLASHEKFVCSSCLQSLPRTGYHRNLRNPMEEKFAGWFPFLSATGHFFYSKDSALSRLIQDLKYRNFPSIGEMLGELVAKELFPTGYFNDIDVIVPLPMYFWKKARRGYNQTEKIASGIGRSAGIEVVDSLKMVRSRKTQTSLSDSQRRLNAVNLFKVKGNVDLNDKGVLLVDDICTTGATLGSAAKALTDTFPRIRLSLFVLGVTF